MNEKELNLIKNLFNYQRMRILRALQGKEKTIKEIAKDLEEKPSRLYYHINQLEEMNLIKVIREEKVNNLTQKIYTANTPDFNDEFNWVGETASRNKDYIFTQLHSHIEAALSAIYNDLENNPSSPHSEASLINASLTRDEWKEVNKKIRDLISDRDKESSKKELLHSKYIILTYLEG